MSALRLAICAILMMASSAHAITFPTAPPADAVSATITPLEAYGNTSPAYLKIWHEQGALWVMIDPGSVSDVICSSQFSFIQNGMQFEKVTLIASNDWYLCGDIYIPTIFRAQVALAKGFDENGAVTIIFGDSVIQAPAGAPIPTPEVKNPEPKKPDDNRPQVTVENLANLKVTCKVGNKTTRAVATEKGFACTSQAKPGRRMTITVVGTAR